MPLVSIKGFFICYSYHRLFKSPSKFKYFSLILILPNCLSFTVRELDIKETSSRKSIDITTMTITIRRKQNLEHHQHYQEHPC